jgi:UbiD family decarboxylase
MFLAVLRSVTYCCYISCKHQLCDQSISGRTNVGSRRLALRNRTQAGTNVTAPSDLKRIYEGCVKRGKRLPMSFTLGCHPSISSPPPRASKAGVA